MHIVMLCQRFYYGRGQEVHVYNLANNLAKLGNKVTIFSSDITPSPMFIKELKFQKNVKVVVSRGMGMKYPPNQILFPNLGEELMKLKNVDIIHAHGAMCYSSLVAITIARTRKIPFIFTPHFHPWRFFEQKPYRYLREAYEKIFTIPIMKYSKKVIAVSPFEKQYLVKRHKLNSRKIKIIPNGINTFYYPSIVSRRSVRKHYKIPENKEYIITFGSVSDPRKGLDRCLKIFKLINKKKPNTHLIIAGWKYTKHNDYLANLVDELKLNENISTLGYVAENEKVALIKMSHLLISPTSYEAFGIVLGEAMVLEVPVVVTRVGGTPFVVRHGKTGYTVGRYNSIKSFVQYSLELINDQKLRRNMGKEGRKIILKYFTWQNIAKQVNQLYKSQL